MLKDNFLYKNIFLNLFLVFFLYLFHLGATKFGWYYFFYELDIVSHLLGGAIIFLTLQNISIFLGNDFNFLKLIFAVFIVALFWEFFEFFVDKNYGFDYNKILDSISDLFFGILGAFSIHFLMGKIYKNIYNKVDEK